MDGQEARSGSVDRPDSPPEEPFDLEKDAQTALDEALIRAQAVREARPSRENSLACTKIEEAQFWGNRDQEKKEAQS